MPRKIIRVGGASGFWGDSAIALPQLLRDGNLDYIVFDYLAEITMSILARARAADPAMGYATDFVKLVAKFLPEIARQNVKLVANAGGVNPRACADALETLIAAAGLKLKVAVVLGDDLRDRADEFRGMPEMFSGTAMPEKLLSLNVYLSAVPIAAALAAGADIVVTGRCVDSAIVLGPCIHEFGWSLADYDRLSGGSLAGHILECGAQASGGLFTDWEDTGDWADIGYPIAEIEPDGTFTVTKLPETGGIVSRGTVSEQLVYEIGNPRAYVLPDVVCDWADVILDDVGPDRVRVSNAKGRSAPSHYKASATWQDGFRIGAMWTIIGDAAAAKAAKVSEAVLRRVSQMLADSDRVPFTEINVEILGSEAAYGPHSRALLSREVILKIAAKHPEAQPLELLAREFTSAGTSMAPGFTGMGGNRPKVMPVVRLFSLLVPKEVVPISVEAGDEAFPVAISPSADTWSSAPPVPAPCRPISGANLPVPLLRLAWGRSGDKGNDVNIGIIARRPEYLDLIRAALSAEAVADYFRHYGPRTVERFDLPGINAVNFLLSDVLGGGGIASLRNDPQGKGFAQMLLSYGIPVPLETFADVNRYVEPKRDPTETDKD